VTQAWEINPIPFEKLKPILVVILFNIKKKTSQFLKKPSHKENYNCIPFKNQPIPDQKQNTKKTTILSVKRPTGILIRTLLPAPGLKQKLLLNRGKLLLQCCGSFFYAAGS